MTVHLPPLASTSPLVASDKGTMPRIYMTPSLVAQVIIINAPLGAGFVWKAASVFLPPSTRQKINILSRGSSGLAELQRLVRPLWHCVT